MALFAFKTRRPWVLECYYNYIHIRADEKNNHKKIFNDLRNCKYEDFSFYREIIVRYR